MTDWRTYDTVAEAYERVAAPRFRIVARHLLSVAAPAPGARLLDLGTGTGAVPAAAAEPPFSFRRRTGCDLSFEMLSRARRSVAGLLAVRADITRLPFANGAFEIATANCVLSHVPDPRGALLEVRRVLTRPGSVAMSSWMKVKDPYAAAWSELLETVAGRGAVERALGVVAPLEDHFSSGENVRAALLEAGFEAVRLEAVAVSFTHSVEDYVAERALTASGRLGRNALGDVAWMEFLARAEAELRHRFGATVSYERRLVMAVGRLG